MEAAESLLLTPGPVRIPAEVMAAIARPPLHQRTPEFEEFWREMQPRMQYLFQTLGPTLLVPGSGTTGMEMTMRSLFPPGAKVAIQDTGKFSARWVAYGRRLGWEVVPVRAPWFETVTLAQVRDVAAAHPDLAGWVLTHVETSTGMAIDLEEIAFFLRGEAPETLIVVDAICSVGIQALYQDAWGLDAVVAASQKGLANPAGCCLVGLSERAVAHLTPSDKHDGLHLAAFYEYGQRGSYPFTPPVQLMYGLDAALRTLQAEGLPARWIAIQARAQWFRGELKRLGATQANPPHGAGVTAFYFAGRDNEQLREQLRTVHGIIVANGQEAFRGKRLRVGHFGDVGQPEMERLVEALEMELNKLK
ncbi:MAG: aminotransferase class V-fold PLP-dependent enzyme [Bacteroidota bacterium]